MKRNVFRPPQNREERVTAAFIRVRDTADAAVRSGGRRARSYIQTLRRHLDNAERAAAGEAISLAANKRAAANKQGKKPARGEQWYVFEMKKREPREPLRQVNKKPLTREAASAVARIGAQKGTHARTVTKSPESSGFRYPDSYYEAGTGEKKPY